MVISVTGDLSVAEVLRLLADPTRAAIVEALAAGPACNCHLVEDLGLAQPNVSNHLRALRQAGLVVTEPHGRYTYYRLLPRSSGRQCQPPQRARRASRRPTPTPAGNAHDQPPVATPRRRTPRHGAARHRGRRLRHHGRPTLSPDDVGLQLLENSIATAFALTVLILMLGPISGAHFNPVVSAADWWLGRHGKDGLSAADLGAYTVAQIIGAILGALLANAMFAVPMGLSTKHRSAPHLWLGELVATAGLLLLIFALVRTGRAVLAAPAVGAYIGAAYWFTSSTSFANPAVTIGRAFSNTFAGIAPASIPGFIVAQLVGGIVGVGLIVALYPAKRRTSDAVILADVDAEHAAATGAPDRTR